MGTTDMGNRTEFLSGRIPIVSDSWDVGGAGISISSTRSRDAWHEPTPRFLPPVQSLFCRACGNRLLMRRSAILLPCLLSFWLACSAQKPVESPKQVLDAYAQALKAGRTQEAYDLLSDQAKNSISFEAFQRMVQENPGEIQEIAQALERPSGPPLVTATVTTPNGETLLLVYEND